MDHHTVGHSIRRGIFLGSIDRIALGGNGPSATIQVQYAVHPNGVDGKKQFSSVAEYSSTSEQFVDFELCGVPRLASTYITAAMLHRRSGEGRVLMFKLMTAIDTAALTPAAAATASASASASAASGNERAQHCVYQHPCSITSLSFQPETEMLAVGTESGDVVLVDLYTSREVSRMKVDSAGVNKVLYMRTGTLATLGDSTKSQIKIWDPRIAAPAAAADGSGGRAQMALQQQLSNSYSSISLLDSPPRARNNPRFTSMTAHAVQEKLVSGMANGSVMLWDLRSEASIEFAPHTSVGE